MYTVYQIRGPLTPTVYIGYCPGNTPLDYFINVAIRQSKEENRFDVRFVKEHGGVLMLNAVTLHEVETEWEAFVLRNEERAKTNHSISGPTNWPPSAHTCAVDKANDRIVAAFEMWTARTTGTARDAWAAGKWTQNDIRYLCIVHTKEAVMKDLDTLTPTQFVIKYEATMN